ncbi:Glycosyltransferase involved in cell wall bisynthesis [Chromohalobacter canadensis]|uniref:Glycosyltransferase involved in cell wall bisynthesis n=1 Tax=Chromohalobacter canadensis TaxID=141389 RepID=A0A285VFR8_9GAMM|nr:glycosyltransferase family 4 protein [Chromohalobacter canadensis]SOC51391.1 Glycosyltransferase involved in cell wall bisynthesis [Chromohalobacter canadensis]
MQHKVLHICLSRGWGGLEMYPARIIPELARQGWCAYVLTLEGTRLAKTLADCEATEVRSVRSPTRALWQLPALVRWLRRSGIGVVHCHKSSDLRLGALLKCLCPELRLVFTDHMGVTRPKQDPYHRWVYRHVDRVLSISEATLMRNRQAFPLPASRITRLYLGIDTADFVPQLDATARQELRDTLGIPREAVAMALPGRLTPGKGQQLLLDAFIRLRDAGDTQSHLVLIGGLEADEGGNPTFIASLQQQVREQGLDERVTFTGFRRDLPRLFEVMDIVCVPSRNEAFGLTVIEAMAAGKAVVGADSGAIPELIGCEGGRLANPQDPVAWAAMLGELRDAPALRERLGANACRFVNARFTLARHVSGLCEIYADAA